MDRIAGDQKRPVGRPQCRHRQRKQLHRRVGEAMESLLGERLGEFQSIIAEHFLRVEAWARAAVSHIADRPDLNLARLAVAEALAGELPTVESATGSAGSTTSAVIPGRRSALPAGAGHWAGTRRRAADRHPSAMIGLALAVQGQWAKAGQLLSQAVPAPARSVTTLSPPEPGGSRPAWGRSTSPRAAGQGPAAPCARHSGSGRARRGTPCASARTSAPASRPSPSPCVAAR
jgi:hypothetical protein